MERDFQSVHPRCHKTFSLRNEAVYGPTIPDGEVEVHCPYCNHPRVANWPAKGTFFVAPKGQ
jgi:hypothetical protein